MGNYSQLKAAINAAITANGQNEITGTVLNNVLNTMVTSIGSGYLFNGVATPSTAPGTPDQNVFYVGGKGTYSNFGSTPVTIGAYEIGFFKYNGTWSNEKVTLTVDEQVTSLSDNLITSGAVAEAINNALNEGYLFKGVATPSMTPAERAHKIFYLAVEGGTYTNFQNYGTPITLQDGISIIYGDVTWIPQLLVGIDDNPTSASDNLVRSGGVASHIVYDISEANSGATFADLTAALNNGNNIPEGIRKGGMSVKFVQSSDNKYVSYRLMATSFSTTPSDWQGVDVEPTVGSKNLVESNGVGEKFFPNNPSGLKGFVFCEVGGFDDHGRLNNMTNRARIISKKITRISLNGQTDISFCVFGNNTGVGGVVTQVVSWQTTDFINDTEYEYLFVMLKHIPSEENFDESPILYIEFSDYNGISVISDVLEQKNFKPVASDAVFKALNSISTRISSIASIYYELHPNFDGNNGYYKTDGTVQPYNGLQYSDKFGVKPGQVIVADVVANNLISVISYFDENDLYIAKSSVIGISNSGQKEYMSIVPDGAVSCAISGSVTGAYIKVYRLKDLNIKTLLVERGTNITETLTYANGFYGSNGAWSDADNWRTSQKIECTNIKSISANIAANNLVYAIVFYDQDGKKMLTDSILGSNISGAIVNANIPEFAKYFSITSFIANGYKIELVVNLLTELSYLERDVTYIHNWINVKAHEDYVIASAYKYLNNIGVATSIEAAFVVSDYIDASNINAVRFTGIQGTELCNCAWYADTNEASVVESRVGYGNNLGTTTMLYERPLQAKYFRLSFRHDSYYKYEFSIDKTIRDNINQRLIKNPIEKTKRMTLIIIYGQSLSIGADSTVVISSSPYPYNNAALMFRQGVKARAEASSLVNLVPLVEVGTETPARGMAEALIESIMTENLFDKNSEFWNERQLILSCPGKGGATIDELSANNNYQYVENVITAAYNYCINKGYELEIPAWCWLQGEQDLKEGMSATTYKSKLLDLQDMVCASIQTITGITKRPKCIIYQPNAQSLFRTGDTGEDDQFDYNYDHMGVPTAFMELARDNDEFIASAPSYILDPCPETAGYWIHCSAQSYKLLGAMLGYNYKKYIIDGISNKGVVPTNVSINGTTIKIKYNVPCPPLSFDTDYVRKVSNMGFSVVKSDNSDIISSVSLFNDTVTIECSESPVGCKLRYGMNGDFIIIPDPQYPYRGIDGREHGARGNLRDNQGHYIYKEIQNDKYPLHNWAYTFEMLLNS